MKYSYLIIALILSNCVSNQQDKSTQKVGIKSNRCFIYPSAIDTLQLRDLYDSARWYLYTWNCDILYKPKNDSLVSRPLGELELKFENFAIKHDTLALIFEFIDKGEPILSSMMRDERQLITGVGFDTTSKKKIYMVSSNINITYKGGNNRFENPLQPEVLKYIKENWERLDNCFRELAEQKGIKR